MAPVALAPDVVPLVVGLGGAPRLAVPGALGRAVRVTHSVEHEGEDTFGARISSSYSRALVAIASITQLYRADHFSSDVTQAVVAPVLSRECFPIFMFSSIVPAGSFPLVRMSRIVAAVGPGVVVGPELGAVTVPTFESISAVGVTVAVALPESAGSFWSAAVATAAPDHRAAGALFIGTGTVVTRGTAVLQAPPNCLTVIPLHTGSTPRRSIFRIVRGAVVEGSSFIFKRKLAPVPFQPIALKAVDMVTLARLK